MAESLLVRAQAAGGSSGTQLVIGPAFSQSSIQSSPCTVNSSSMLMAAVRIYNGMGGNWKQSHPEWFIVVVGEGNISLNVTMYNISNNSTTTYTVAYANLSASQLSVWSSTYACGVDGRVFCTA